MGRYCILLNDTLKGRIDARAAELGLSRASYIRLAVSKELEHNG